MTAETNEIRMEQHYDFAPERVWRALTDSDAMAKWLMPNDFKPVVGHRFQFRMEPMPGWRGYVDCEVTELEPPRTLAYTWRGDDDWTCATTVRWTLEPANGGTLLTLEHTGFEEPWGRSVVEMLGGGWKGMLEKLLPEAVASMDNVASS